MNSPLYGISSLIGATIVAGSFVGWMCLHFNVPWSPVHWWIFGFIWVPAFLGFMVGGRL